MGPIFRNQPRTIKAEQVVAFAGGMGSAYCVKRKLETH